MYSVVLLMALTGGGDQTACHRGWDWCGDYGGYGCGCYGDYYGGYGCGCYGGWSGGWGGYYGGYVASVDPYTAPATIVVRLPADARLTIDDAPTVSTSDRRVFQTPGLPTGQDFAYTLKAEISHDGKSVVISKRITVRAGKETDVELKADAAGVASQ